MKWEYLDSEDGCNRIRVQAGWSEVAADYEDIISAYSTTRVPGFRPGKVPRSVIKGRFHKQIRDDFSQRIGQRLGRETLRDEGADHKGPIGIGNMECGKEKPFQFSVSSWPMPEIKLRELGALHELQDGSDPRDLISQRLLDLASFTVSDALVEVELGPDEGECVRDSDKWKAAADRVRLMLILKKIAAREGIEVSEDNVEQRITEKASEFGEDSESRREDKTSERGWMAAV